jgi:7-keto-8-aminopelargonate synthetase-like enzyme
MVRASEDLHTSDAFTKHLGMFAYPKGSNLIKRTRPVSQWISERTELSTWPYARSIERSPATETRLRTQNGAIVEGLNFGSQDYLGLASHPSIHEAALRALRDYGPHSAASPMLQGNTRLSKSLEREIGEFLNMDHVLLFPTGWAAGFGTITGLIRADDYIVIDQLAHACLMQGTRAATEKHFFFRHNDLTSLTKRLRSIRAKDTEHAILVVSEGLFSMDSDFPDIASLQAVCHEFDAVLMVDVAHDLGAMGPGGTGQIGLQKFLGKVDLVMGSFSKTFSSNGGFLATHDLSVKQFVSIYGGSHTYSNALSPIQAGVVTEAIRIVRSEEGDRLREKSLNNINHLREQFAGVGAECLGSPSNIVPVSVGDETLAKWTSCFLERDGLLANLVEFPAVARGKARFRFQVMATHTENQIERAVGIFARSRDAALKKTASVFAASA